MRYEAPSDYLRDLELELERQARGNEADLVELKRDVCLERLAARFDPETSAIKGGFGIRSMLQQSPLTQDIDVMIGDTGAISLSKQKIYNIVTDYVLDHASTAGPDRFKFKPSSAGQIIDLQGTEAAVRIWFQVQVAERSFGTVVVDAGLRMEDLPTEKHTGRNVLGFAEIKNPTITTLSREYLAADKVSLFLEKGMTGDRPRDIVHAALLLEQGKYDQAAFTTWLQRLAEIRNVWSKLGSEIEQPTSAWSMQVNGICQRYGLPLSAELCYERVGWIIKRFFDRDG